MKLSGPKHCVRCLVTVGNFSASFLRAVHLFDGQRSSVENEAGESTGDFNVFIGKDTNEMLLSSLVINSEAVKCRKTSSVEHECINMHLPACNYALVTALKASL